MERNLLSVTRFIDVSHTEGFNYGKTFEEKGWAEYLRLCYCCVEGSVPEGGS